MDEKVRQLLERAVQGFEPDVNGRLDALTREHRNRSRRSKVIAGVLALALASASFVGLMIAFRVPEQGRGSPRSSSASSLGVADHLFLAGDGELWDVDPTTRTAQLWAVPQMSPGDPPFRIAQRGDSVVFFGGDKTYAANPSDPTKPQSLGASRFFVPSGTGDRVWLAIPDPHDRYITSAVREVDVLGNVTVNDTPMPQNRALVGAVGRGLVLQRPEGNLELWDPLTGSVVDVPGQFVVATLGTKIASCGDPCNTLYITDVQNGSSLTAPTPPGFGDFSVNAGAFSPDGSTLALPARTGGGVNSPNVLLLIDVATGGVRPLADAEVPGPYAFAAWAPSGTFLFFAGHDEAGHSDVFDYRPGDQQLVKLDVKVGPFYGATGA